MKNLIPKVSIVTAVYNREKYLGKMLKTCLSQTYQNLEIILVDDGSTDNSLQIANSFKDNRLQIFTKKHTRCWDTKNFCIKNATGKFIVFVDSDDFLSNNYVKTAINDIMKFPNYDYYYPTKLLITDEKENLTNKIWRYIEFSLDERWKIINLFAHTTIGGIPHTGAFIDKNVFIKNGLYNGKLYNFGDTDFIIRNALNIKFKLLPNLLTYYKRHHETQICNDLKYRNQTVANLILYIKENYPYNYILPDISNLPSIENKKKIINFFIEKLMIQASEVPNNPEPFLKMAKKFLMELRNL